MSHVEDVKITHVTVCGIKWIQMYQNYIFEQLAVIRRAIYKCFELQTMNTTCHNLKIIHWVQRWKTMLSEICHWHSLECCSVNRKQVTCRAILFWTRRQSGNGIQQFWSRHSLRGICHVLLSEINFSYISALGWCYKTSAELYLYLRGWRFLSYQDVPNTTLFIGAYSWS